MDRVAHLRAQKHDNEKFELCAGAMSDSLAYPLEGYTAIVRGMNDTTGIALVEVYALN